MHALRLGLQGVEYLRSGRITLPIPQPYRDELSAVRQGQRSLADVVAWLAELEAELTALAATRPLPPEPDWRWINDWLHRSHLEYWGERSGRMPP